MIDLKSTVMFRIIVAMFFVMCEYCFATTFHDPRFFSKKFDTNAYNCGLIQDRDGFIWVGSTKGLIKYDGYTTTTFKQGQKNSPSANPICSVFEDSMGIIWLGTFGGGLNSYNKQTGSFTHYLHSDQQNSISSNGTAWSSHLIDEDKLGNIWFGTVKGLNRINPKTGEVSRYTKANGFADDYIWSVFVDRKGRIWCGTDNGGAILLNSDGKVLSHYIYSDKSNSIGQGAVYTIYEDYEGDFWFGSSIGGVSCLKEKSGVFVRYGHQTDKSTSLSNNSVFNIFEFEPGKMWTNGYYDAPRGVEIIDKKTGTVTQIKHESDGPLTRSSRIMGIHRGRNGIFWIVDNTEGISIYDPNRFDITSFSSSDHDNALGNNAVLSMFEDKSGDMWFSFVGGLNKLDRDSGTITFYGKDLSSTDALQSDFIFSVLEDNKGTFWIATDDGALNVFDRSTGKVTKRYVNHDVPHVARSMVEDRLYPGVFWYGTEGYGLVRFDSNTGKFTNYKDSPDNDISSDIIGNIVADFANNLWICTKGGGLVKFGADRKTFSTYSFKADGADGSYENSVNDCLIDRDGVLWITTDNLGLVRFDPRNGIKNIYGFDSGFLTLSLFALLDDDNGNLWITSDDGLYFFCTSSEKVLRCYTEGDGLSSNVYSIFPTAAIKSRDGNMWFCGTNGVNTLKPSKMKSSSYNPPLYFTALSQGGQTLDIDTCFERIDQIELDWKEPFLEFEVAALNYTAPSNSKYKYMLENWDKEWFYSGKKNFGRYSGLPGGDYILKIRGTRSDGSWSNDNELKLKIKVVPPFWQATWFYTGVALIIFSVIWLAALYVKRLNAEVRERKKAENALRVSKGNLQVILDYIGDGVIATDSDGKIIQMNPIAQSLTGWSNDDASQRYLKSVYSVGDQTGETYDLFESVKEGSLEQGVMNEAVLNSKSGRSYEISQQASIIETDNAECSDGVVVIFRDETERNAIKSQLQQSQKMDSLGQLAGGIAHDFNNMLGGIMGFSELISCSTNDGESTHEYANLIRSTAERAADLTRKLLSFSRKGKSVAQLVDLHDVIQESVMILERSIDKKIEVAKDLSADEYLVFGDSTELHNCFLNLGVNARDAMPEGGVLKISTGNLNIDNESELLKAYGVKEGDYIKVVVEDNGSGINPSVMKRIFEPFFTTKDVGKGTGLGLAAVYGALKNHEGAIEVESEIGVGTRFSLVLPIRKEENELENNGGKENDDTRTDKGNKGTVLIIDDEVVMCKYCAAVMKNLGYDSLVGHNGREGLRLYRENSSSISFVILDMLMPVMDGHETFYEIIKEFPDANIIMCSGYTKDASITQMLNDGMKDFLRKPFQKEELLNAIKKLDNMELC